MGKIYRFISFESFVDMVQSKHLVFVHPSLWDDPKELQPFEEWNRKNELSAQITYELRRMKLFAQSWTSLSESDALWRIYSHNGFSIRIAVDESKIFRLNNVTTEKVIYTNDFSKLADYNDSKIFCVKRKSFAHEKEVRLLHQFQFQNEDDLKYQKETFIMHVYTDYALDFYKGVSIEDLKNDIELRRNHTFQQEKIKPIEFSHIPHFIDSVMLNPLAPDWFDITLLEFCKTNKIKYLGKSKLYEK